LTEIPLPDRRVRYGYPSDRDVLFGGRADDFLNGLDGDPLT
jgi:hypothetical protein